MIEFFATVVIVVLGLVVLWLLFEWPEIFIPLIIIIVLVKSCSVTVETGEEEIEKSTDEIQIQGEEKIESVIEDSISEECIDGITYILVIKGGKNFMTSKQDRYGDNERCYE